MVEITLSQSLDRFQALVYGWFFMVNWVDSIIKRIWFSGMVRRECIRFIYILFSARQVLLMVTKLAFQNF